MVRIVGFEGKRFKCTDIKAAFITGRLIKIGGYEDVGGDAFLGRVIKNQMQKAFQFENIINGEAAVAGIKQNKKRVAILQRPDFSADCAGGIAKTRTDLFTLRVEGKACQRINITTPFCS